MIMTTQHGKNRYGALSISLHWLMLLLLVAVYACIELREFYPKGSDPREALKAWHFMLGLSVFFLVFVRIAIRFSTPVPDIVPPPPAWQMRSAKLMHLALYALMIVMPLLGWLTLSAAGKTIPFFGMELPALIGANKTLAGNIKEIHETVGSLGYALIGVHTVAALYHHYIMHDNTMQRMLPGKN
jgi:cytochrome b561